LWRLRWVGFALLGAVVFRIALPGAVGAFRQTVPAVVVSHAVEAGTQLTANDVTVAKVSAGVVPEGVLTGTDQVVGRRVSVGLPAGMALVPEVLAGAGALDGAPPGTVVAPVRLSDPKVARLIRAGDRVDILASPGASGGGSIAPAARLVRQAPVLSATDSDDDGAGLILLAVTPTEAELLGGAASWAVLSAVLVG
jgi:Flp pilus assembly protein CpaB